MVTMDSRVERATTAPARGPSPPDTSAIWATFTATGAEQARRVISSHSWAPGSRAVTPVAAVNRIKSMG